MRKAVGGLLSVAATFVFFTFPQARAEETAPPGWTFNVMPYLWLPSINGNLRYGKSGTTAPSVSLDAQQVLQSLNFAAMAAGEARKGNWLIATDYIYLNMGNSDSKVKSVDFNPGPGPINISTTQLNSGTQTSLSGSVWTLVGGYAAVTEPAVNLDVIAGFRYLGINAKTNWQLTADVTLPNSALTFNRSGSVHQSDDVVTALIGAKGQIKIDGTKVFIPYYADIGSGGSTFTWQGAGGLGYRFDWGDVRLEYRYLYYRQSGNQLLENVSFAGPGIGVNFRF